MPMQIWRSLFPQKGKQFSTSFRLFLGDLKINERNFSTPHCAGSRGFVSAKHLVNHRELY